MLEPSPQNSVVTLLSDHQITSKLPVVTLRPSFSGTAVLVPETFQHGNMALT